MSGRMRIRPKGKTGGKVRIRDGVGFREVDRGGWLHRNYVERLEEEIGRKLSIDLLDEYDR